jgi:hypothetical protein
MQSPEETGRYVCLRCHNRRSFIGYDDLGYPGPEECECDKDPCECKVTLSQPFTIAPDGAVRYHAFEGGGFGAEIGSYTRIKCAVCGQFIWRDGPVPSVPS